jgi:hypothetical protein
VNHIRNGSLIPYFSPGEKHLNPKFLVMSADQASRYSLQWSHAHVGGFGSVFIPSQSQTATTLLAFPL